MASKDYTVRNKQYYLREIARAIRGEDEFTPVVDNNYTVNDVPRYLNEIVHAIRGEGPDDGSKVVRDTEYYLREIAEAIDEKGGGGGGTEQFVVTVTMDEQTGKPTGNKTFAEIDSAYQSGKTVIFDVIGIRVVAVPYNSNYVGAFAADGSINEISAYEGENNTVWSASTLAYAVKPVHQDVTGLLGASIYLEPNTFFILDGECASLTLNGEQGGQVRFTSGATATSLTVTGATMPDDFQVEANRVYEINVYEGYGVAVSWEVSNA